MGYFILEKKEKELLLQSLTPEWRNELTNLVQLVVREEMGSIVHGCRFNITDDEALEVTHAMRSIKSMGKGDLAEGIQVSIDNHRWMKAQRERSEKISSAFVFVLITSIASGLCLAIWHGFKTLVGK